MPPQNSIPVTIITGFLGSGKTTVLNRLLKHASLADTAVIVNEFGEIGIDHHLIEQAVENAVLMKNGCICCSVRGDIADTLELLWDQRDRGVIPFFSRIAIETTGLADPGPVAHTLVEAGARYACHLDGIVTTVDALHGAGQLDRQEEARNQVALADRILLTKTDLATREQAGAGERSIRAFNRSAPIYRTIDGAIDPAEIFGLGPATGVADERIARWLAAGDEHDHDAHHAHFHHDQAIGSCVLNWERPIAADALRLWLDSLLSLRGAELLRLKGLVRLAGERRPLVIQAVHHVMHKPIWLEAWPGEPRTALVLITRGLSPQGLSESFAAAMRAG